MISFLKKSSLFKSFQKRTSGGIFSFLPIFLLILIPKCPFCVAAYFGFFLLFWDLQEMGPFFAHIKMILVGLIFLSILSAYKGKRTLFALILVSLCGLFIALANYSNLSILPNYFFYLILFFAIWYNGNFSFVIKYIKEREFLKTDN